MSENKQVRGPARCFLCHRASTIASLPFCHSCFFRGMWPLVTRAQGRR